MDEEEKSPFMTFPSISETKTTCPFSSKGGRTP